jgi:hypothetical protein
MLLEVYDKNTLDRVDVIRTYTFVQYTDYFNDVGTFSVKVPVSEKSLQYLLIEGNYILFEKLGDKLIMGIIKYFHKEGVETPTVEIKGYMLPHVLTYRCFVRTYQKSGKVFDIQRDFLTKMYINPDDLKRRIDMFLLASEYDANTQEIDYCKTGSDAAESIRDMNMPYHYGFGVVPVIVKYNPTTDRPQNFSGMIFEQYVPVDHRVGNTSGNDPVIFDTELNNVENIVYEIDATKAKTMAVVAGQDSGDDRKVVEVGDLDSIGIDRNELYVDARDLQKQEDNSFEFSSERIIGSGAEQTVWNSASVASLDDVEITSFNIKGNFSVENNTELNTGITLYAKPYLGGVSYTPVNLVDMSEVESGIINVSFDVTVNASDDNVDHFDSYVIFCLSAEGYEYICGGDMNVVSVPEQHYATTDEEYEQMLGERGLEKLEENVAQYAFEATVFTETNNSFVYGRDYKNGDYVTVIDRNLGMAVGVQITGVTKSLTETGEILDLIFGNQIL